MKPYGATTEDYGDTWCCPGHDFPRLRKWSGRYRSAHHMRASRELTKLQNRLRRHRDKQQLQYEISKECGEW